MAKIRSVEELKQARLWFLFRLEWNAQKDKYDKRPYDVNGGALTESKRKIGGLATYKEAAEAAAKKRGKWQVGFMLPPGMVFIDIDHKDTEHPVTKDIMARIQSYTERSISGNGVHIYGQCDIRKIRQAIDLDAYYTNNHAAEVECYLGDIRPQLAVFSGNCIIDKPFTECSAAVVDFFKTYMSKDGPTDKNELAELPALEVDPDDLEDVATDIICELRKQKNGEKFIRLFDQGDLSGYASQSEADLALCALIAYRTGANEELIDCIFRSSALYRDKWEARESYRTQTIQKGIAACNGVFHYSLTEPTLSDLVAKLKEMKAAFKPHNDLGTARIFASLYGDRHLYCPEWHSWVLFDGQKLVRDTDGIAASQSIKRLVDALQVYAANSGLEDENETKYRKYIAQLGDYRPRRRVLDDAKDLCCISAQRLDSNDCLLNCLNGTLDLSREPELRPHSATDMITKLAPVVYDPTAEAPRWIDFLGEVLQGNKEKARFLQKYAGLALTGDTSEETMVILYGATTRNGKSTFVETLLRMLGDYSMTIRPETLANQKGRDGNKASSDVARLKGARLVNASEPPKGMLFDAAQLKSMTGRDTITARRLYQDEIEFTPQFKLLMNTNYLPQVSDQTLFSSGRINVVTFDKHFTAAEQDKRLKDRLSEEAELSGILNWCIEGLRLYRKEGLTPPACVRDATRAYKDQSDKIAEFIEDVLDKDPASNLPGTSLYRIYAMWCRNSGYAAEGKQNFFRDMRDRNLLRGSGTIGGKTVRNVIAGYRIAAHSSYAISDFYD